MSSGDSFGSIKGHLEEALTNTALFSVLNIRATMFSRARIRVVDIATGKELPNDPFLKLMAKPNFSQSQQDFLYSHEFFKGTGNNITRVISSKPNDIDKVFSLENLIPSQIDYNGINKFENFVFSKTEKDKVKDRSIKYKMGENEIDIPISELLFFYDVTNGLEPKSRFRSPSRIDSLIQPLMNIREAQKAKNINLKLSAKHIISSGITGETMKDGLMPDEKNDIERNFMKKDIMASESNLNVHSLSNNMAKLMYDEGTNSDLLKIATAYGINRDVLDWSVNGASTYDNKNQGLLQWMQNSIEFEASDFAGTWNNYFDYPKAGKRIELTYGHLSIMQAVNDLMDDRLKKKAETAKLLMDIGMTSEQAMLKVGLKEMNNG
jgi:hypothetical protein